MTKEMSADKRTDVLTDALLYYGERLRKKFGVSLKGKLSRAESLLSETDKKIKDLSRSLPVTQQKLEEWQTEELASIIPKERVLELEWHERYADLLLENKRLKNELVYSINDDQQKVEAIQKKKTSNERSLAAIEKKQRIGKRWKDTDGIFQDSHKSLVHKKKGNLLLKMQRLASERWFLLEMKKKYADGQSIAVKLSKQISKVTEHIRGNLISYNELEMTNPLQFEEVKDPRSLAYSDSENASKSEECPASIKRQLVDLMCMKKRCDEEIGLVKREMIQLLSFHLAQINYIKECMKSLTDTVLDKGIKALLSAKKLALELNHSRLEQLWQNLHISPYHWEAVVYCASISDDPLIAINSTDEENALDLEDANSEFGDESERDDFEDVDEGLAGDVLR